MEKEFKISERKHDLLISAVESYIENASPITSEKVHNTLFKHLSSATLRNELSALEEMGYLRQLHTSSGRVPTTKAYRYIMRNLEAGVTYKVKVRGFITLNNKKYYGGMSNEFELCIPN